MRGTKWGFLSVAVVAMIFLSHPAAAADPCADLLDPVPRIAACTQSINSGKWKGHDQAVNYINRGIAYGNKDDTDHA
jgi:hypothetical protein